MNKYFHYTKEATDYLKAKDPQLGIYIDAIGKIKRCINPDLFSSLVESIISQQISTKAALTVSRRLRLLVGEFTPDNILQIASEELQKCGLSHRKTSYILNLAEKVKTKEVDLEKLNNLSDDEVIKELVKIKGIGQWTAEMLMIFSMNRMNILSYNDLAIQRGLKILYCDEAITKDKFTAYYALYTPYASVASLYLWAIASNQSN